MSDNTSKPVEARAMRPGIPLWKKLLFATLTCVFILAMLEIGLWGMGVSTLIDQEDPFRGFSGLVTVFQRDGEFCRTRPTTLETFNDQSFLAEKPANGFRIFCLGGSSSFGFPWGAEAAFTSIVGELLAASHPERHVAAVNASGVSYAMHRLNIVADELLTYDPDLFIIYSGHNEFIEPAFFEALKHRSVTRTNAEYFLSHSRVYSGMRLAFERLGDDQSFPGEQLDAPVQRDMTHSFSLQEKEAIVAEYHWRLERLVRRAHEAGAKVLLATVPCNLRQWRPEASTTLTTLSNDDRQIWSEAFGSGMRRLKGREFEAAIGDLERAAGLAPSHAETQFLLAQAYEGLSRWDEARVAYQRACDTDASPVRRLSGINEAIREVGRQQGALVVDVDRIFEDRSEHGLVGFNLVEDYVHPTREGHEVIAWHISSAIDRAAWLDDKTLFNQALYDQIIAERRRRPMKKNATWLYNQGVVLKKQGQREVSIQKFREALAISPNYRGAMRNLGNLLTATGQAAEAIEVMERLVEINPKIAEYHNELANALLGQRRVEEAVTHYREALRLKPSYAELHNNMGVALRRLGRFDQALRHCQEALRLKPDVAEAQHNLGITLKELGRVEEALVHYEEALRLKPDFAEAHHDLANALQLQGRSEQAVTLYEQALQLKPDYAQAYCSLANTLQSLGRVEQAVTHYHEALRLMPDYAEAHFNLANALLSLGRIEQAATHYQEVLQHGPDYAQAHSNLANALQRLGRFDEAIHHCERVVRLMPESAQAQFSLANALLSQRRVEDAAKHYQKALRLKPDYAEAHNNLANTLQRLGRFDEAILHCEKALQLKPDVAETHNNLANALRRLERFDEARLHCEQALQLKPDYAQAHNNLGKVLQGLERFDQSATHYQEAVRLKPDYAEAQINLAWLLATCPDAQVRDGQRALELADHLSRTMGQNGNVALLETRAAANAEVGNFDEAVRWQEKALQAESDALQDILLGRLELYQSEKPFRDTQ